MSRTRAARRWLAALTLPLAAGCADSAGPTDPPTTPRELSDVFRAWTFYRLPQPRDADSLVSIDGEHAENAAVVVHDSREFGSLTFSLPGVAAVSKAEVFSNETGESYWAQAQAPRTAATNGAADGVGGALREQLWYVVDAPNPSLTFTVTAVTLDGIDDDAPPTPVECDRDGNVDENGCVELIVAHAHFGISTAALDAGGVRPLPLDAGSDVELYGYVNHWRYRVATTELWGMTAGATFDSLNFELTTAENGGRQVHGRVQLKAPLPFPVPLAGLRVGDTVLVDLRASVLAEDRRQKETFSGAYFRDPVSPVGVQTEVHGLHRVPGRRLALPAPSAAPPCAGAPSAAAGTLQFSAAHFVTGEGGFGTGLVTVTRTGGTAGAVSATVTTADGTAAAGADYRARSALVRWADGQGGARTVFVPIVADSAAEPDETVNVSLAAPGGCATLGAQRTAVLTIRDNDGAPPPPPATFSVGGEVRGLVGSGLVLREQKSGFELRPTRDGPFTIVTGRPDGADYAVVVAAQPVNPLQACTVSGAGAGTIAGANVANILVDCTTPTDPSGSLDARFGSGGRVTVPLPGGATAVAIQRDGKIVAAGESKVLRFNADGTPDQSFGRAGQADFTFPAVSNVSSSLPRGIAIQGDGRIVVVGTTKTSKGVRDGFVVARYNGDGTLDAGFGAGGRVTVDFGGQFEHGRAVALDGDHILVAGGSSLSATNFESADLVVARLLPNGALDPTFGTGGRAHTHFDGATTEATAIGRQPDGRIVAVGAVSTVRREGVDLAVASYTRDGAPDTTFARQGGMPGQLRASFGTEVHPTGLVVQPDGQIAVVGDIGTAGAIRFLLVRVSAEGGVGTPIATALGPQSDAAAAVALLPDGDLVVVGRAGILDSADFGVARFPATGGPARRTFTVDFVGSADGATAVAVQPDGLVIVAGAADNGRSLGLVRVGP